MAIPFGQALAVGLYLFKQKLMRRKKHPLVLMLEPLFRCNLECIGCGKIQKTNEILKFVFHAILLICSLLHWT